MEALTPTQPTSADPTRSRRCNVAAALTDQARARPHDAAIHYPTSDGEASITYAELDALTDRVAHGLRDHGFGDGARVALMVPPGLPFFVLFFAMFKAGTVPVLIDPGIGLKPLKKCLDEAAPIGFIGSSKAQWARLLLGWGRRSIRRLVTVGPRPLWRGVRYRDLEYAAESSRPLCTTEADDMAAILFTSGSTGPPKGVVYRHRHFAAQVDLLREAFGIEAGEVSLPTFPPFALFDPALGMTTVVPDMDPTRPAEADPRKLVAAIRKHAVTQVFGSPALLRVLGDHCAEHSITLDSVRRVTSAGAAVPIAVVRRMQDALPEGALVHTPYGATECLPVASIDSAELDARVETLQDEGEGICVGRPVAPNQLKIIGITDLPIERVRDATEMPVGMRGEIVVHGPTTTDTYWRRDDATRLAKIDDAQRRTWHRMGDIGYLDANGRLWYCGRKSQRVETGNDTLFPDQVEAYFNTHPQVARTALVGIGPAGRQTPVLCVEMLPGVSEHETERTRVDLLQLAQLRTDTRAIQRVVMHPGFPVDIRHNAKIGREQLARWVAEQSA